MRNGGQIAELPVLSGFDRVKHIGGGPWFHWYRARCLASQQSVLIKLVQRPPSPTSIDPALPEPLSRIVLKLLAKMPEDRYQSARGLQADVARCLHALETTGDIQPFPHGKHDIPTCLKPPERLYGREAGLASLRHAFDIASRGHAAIAWVSGAPGIGKTVLVSELCEPVREQKGHFITVQHDALAGDIPS